MTEARYTVILPSGTTGPYTSDDLVQLLRSGKASPDDRVQDAVTHTATTLGKMVPDAEALAAEGARNRVRRSTSDRLPRVSSVPRPQRTPLPIQQAVQAEAQAEAQPAATPDPSPARHAPAAPADSSSGSGRKLALSIGMLAFAAVMTWFTWSEIRSLFPSTPTPPPPLVIAGQWTIAQLQDAPGAWNITVSDGACEITGPDGSRFTSPATVTQETPHFAAVSLTKPHPRFGQSLNFLGTYDGAIIMAGPFEVKAERTP